MSIRATKVNRTGQKSAPGLMVYLGVILFLAGLPFAALLWIAVTSDVAHWPHLLNYVLPPVGMRTLTLLFGVALGSAIIGVTTAWLTVMCAFPGRGLFAWALMLPLAVPVYIAAYSWVELLDYAGPAQQAWRTLLGIAPGERYPFPDIRSTWGAIVIFSFVLYPYVYLTTRLAFRLQGASAIEVARSFGHKPLIVIARIALPLARPAIVAGVVLALLETLNDIGAVEHLGVRTITFAVFETWLNRDSLGGAVQLAVMVLIVVMVLLWIEQRARRHRAYTLSSRDKPPSRFALKPFAAALAFAACALPILLGLGVPLTVLMRYVARRPMDWMNETLLSAAATSIGVALATAIFATGIAYSLLLAARLREAPAIARWGRLITLGYAVPGTVLAIGLLVPVAGFDNRLDGLLRATLGISTGLLLSGTAVIVVYACTVRFIAIAWGSVETGFSRLSPHVDMAARGLGRKPHQLALSVHTPILAPALASGALLVFVDTMKELSATILLRPFGFESLATYIYGLASQAAIEDAAWAALLIVLIGLVPIVLLTRVTISGQQN